MQDMPLEIGYSIWHTQCITGTQQHKCWHGTTTLTIKWIFLPAEGNALIVTVSVSSSSWATGTCYHDHQLMKDKLVETRIYLHCPACQLSLAQLYSYLIDGYQIFYTGKHFFSYHEAESLHIQQQQLIKVNFCNVNTPSTAVVRLPLTKQGYPIIAKYWRVCR